MPPNLTPNFFKINRSLNITKLQSFIEKMKWEKLPTHPSSPGPRWGHSCNTIDSGRLVYVFGGFHGLENRHTNKVHVFDPVFQIWSEPEMKGLPPAPRDSHSSNAVGDYLYVFGGTDGRRPLNDLHILDTTTNTWISPNVRGEGPEPREGHSAAVVGRRLYIFGGCGKSADGATEIYYNDIYILNTETLTWRRAVTAGIPPSPRDSHTCSSFGNLIVVIGGEDEHDFYLSDVHIFDTDTSTWRVLKTSGDKLKPRGGHTAVSFGKHILVFGGFSDERDLFDDLHMLDVENGIWSKLFTEGQGPSARFSVAGDCLDPVRSGVLMFIGGCNKTLDALDDVYLMNTGLVVQHARDGRRLEKLSLRKQLKLKCQEQQQPLPQPVYDSTVFEPWTPSSATVFKQPNQAIIPYGYEGVKSFQARVTQSMTPGFAIETVIDGKLLRGIIFSSNGTSEPKHKPSGSFSGLNPSGKVSSATQMEQDGAEEKQGSDVNGKEVELNGGHKVTEKPELPETTPGFDLRNDVIMSDALTGSGMIQVESFSVAGQDLR